MNPPSSPSSRAQEQAPRPNVIWVLSDQHRGQALSCAGDPNVSTPNLDRLAGEGVWFRRALSGFPLCCPARGSILTGQYPHACVPGHEMRLPEASTTIAHALNAAGYETAWFGKWHLDGATGSPREVADHIVPRQRRGGFKTWLGYENINAPFDGAVHGHRGDQALPRQRLKGFETDALTDLLIQHIHERDSDVPFFSCMSVQPPHDPYTAPAEWMSRIHPAKIQLRPNVPPIDPVIEQARRELAGYYASIENIDHNIGRIRDSLDQKEITQNTYIIYFSDHGDHHGSHGYFRKCTPFEESIRVPFIIGGPCHSHYDFPHETDALLNHVDIAPTTLGLCGLAAPPSMKGVSLAKALQPGGLPRNAYPEAALLQSVVPTMHPHSIDQPWRGIVTRDHWKYVTFAQGPYLLFDLNDDPYELRNLAHHVHSASRRQTLHHQLADLLGQVGDPFLRSQG